LPLRTYSVCRSPQIGGSYIFQTLSGFRICLSQNPDVKISRNLYSAPARERSIVISVFVCLCVCLFASISPVLRVQSTPNFRVYYLSPRFDPSPAALRYVVYFRFSSRRRICRRYAAWRHSEYRCSERRHRVVVRRLTLLLRRIGCVVS